MILHKNNFAFWFCAAVTSINALVSAGFAVSAVLATAANVYAMYAASRSISCVVVIAGLVSLRSRIGIAALAAMMGLVQTCDGVIGMIEHDPAKTAGPFFLAAVTFASVIVLLRSHAPHPPA